MAELVWSELTCPRCGTGVPLNIMSLCATCPECGLCFVDRTAEEAGWYSSTDAWKRGEKWEVAENAESIDHELASNPLGEGANSDDSTRGD